MDGSDTVGQPLKDPGKLFYQFGAIRRSILVSYWLVIILALPLWWQTTSIQRLALPSTRVAVQANNVLKIPINIVFDSDLKVEITNIETLFNERVTREPDRWKGLEVQFQSSSDIRTSPITYAVKAGPENGQENRTLTVHNFDDSAVVETLSALIAPYASMLEQDHRAAEYSSRYRLAFTLLNEDVTSGRALYGWNIRDLINRHIKPITSSLSVLHNFTIESQIQFHAPLAFDPAELGDGSYGLSHEDLTIFVNSAEWTLSSSSSSDPVLHFILFVPSRPLRISDSHSNTFLLPQWGGIVIQNEDSPLDAVFSSFGKQLLALLGAPSHTRQLDLWQLDALLRRRSLENAHAAQDTLQSTIDLVAKIDGMPVDKHVRGDVEDALTSLENMHTAETLNEMVHHSSEATTLASRAFFYPGMLALLYFPAEHKYAVYTPLFASAVIPLIAAGMREIVAWRKQREVIDDKK